MALAQEKIYTLEDIYDLPDGQRAELIDGQIYYMAPPSRMHQEILNYINTEINLYIRKKNGNCKVYPSPFAVFLNEDDRNYVEPDIAVVCDSSKLNDRGCSGAPDWIIEVVSPSSKRMDYFVKLFKYRSAGVREYWIVDSAKNRILVYNFESEDTGDYTFSDSIKADIYDDLIIDFSRLQL
ncbi:MAG: Uma2 family endonuclease [Candidatus Limivivens sp.]|nr:Uma2 family endonuclease [Candidatus Limivivens sp.]